MKFVVRRMLELVLARAGILAASTGSGYAFDPQSQLLSCRGNFRRSSCLKHLCLPSIS